MTSQTTTTDTPRYLYHFFVQEVETCRDLGINLASDGMATSGNYSNNELDTLWQTIVEKYNETNCAYKNKKKILRTLANRIRFLVDPEFCDRHPVIS